MSLLTVEFINSGNQPIKREDYETDIEIELKQTLNMNIRVLSFDIVEREPSNIKNEINGANTYFKISPSLLNPTDKFKIQFLVDFEDVKDITIDVKARITGIHALKKLKEKDALPYEVIVTELRRSIILMIIAMLISVISGSAIIQEIWQKLIGK